jgi:hypothetical protein
MRFFASLLIFLYLIGHSLAGTIDPNTEDSKYIEYAKGFYFVGQISGTNKENQIYKASGVAIKPHFILTAAHVVRDIESCDITFKNKTFHISKIIIPQEFSESNVGYHDIAIGYTKQDLGLEYYPELYENKNEIDKICSISGFGLTGNFISGATHSDGKQRAGSNIIDYIDKHLLVCSPSKTDKKTSLEFLIASGDSGGGLFIDGKLAGINSCVFSKNSPKSDYDTESGHTRISENLEWILANTK